MIFSEEHFNVLSGYERHFTTAIRSRYAVYPGDKGVREIHAIYSTIVKHPVALNTSCSSCIFRLLVECGEMYFKDKQEREQEAKPKRTRKKS